MDILEQLGASGAREGRSDAPLILEASADPGLLGQYRALRQREFVEVQGLFCGHDLDEADADTRTRVLVAVTPGRAVIGGVRIHSVGDGAEIGWWAGSRLVVDAGAGRVRGRIGGALVRAACARALDVGALRFEAHVQKGQVGFFTRLGWTQVRDVPVSHQPHRLMRWDGGRFEQLVRATKEPLGKLLGPLLPADRWLGDDGVPVPGSDMVACVDAITPSMVERDPEWAGWCGMLVTAHDLAAMGAEPIGALDALSAADEAHADRVLQGVRRGADAFDLPVLGGHTQLGVPAGLAVTGLGRTAAPVPSGGGRAGDAITLTADVAGGWRPGYAGRQWDSTSWRTREQLAPMLAAVREAGPRCAKDVSMAGVIGTLGMLAEASGCGAELDVASIPRPAAAGLADWLTCFPGFAVLTTDVAGAPPLDAGAARSATCGRLTREPGVRLRWPDGETTTVLNDGAVSGLGPAAKEEANG